MATATTPRLAVHEVEASPVHVTRLVRGVACLRANRSLVLVDTHNQILDILTPEQQHQLHSQILLEVALYCRRDRLQTQARLAQSPAIALPTRSETLTPDPLATPHLRLPVRSLHWRFLPPPRDRQTLLPPIRQWRRLMGWMQTQPVAIAMNLFQESALVPHLSPLHAIKEHPISPPSIPLQQPSLWRRMLDGLGFGASALAPANASDSFAVDENGAALGQLIPEQQIPHPWLDPDHQGSHDGWLNANQFSFLRRHHKRSPDLPSFPVRSRWLPDWVTLRGRGGDTLITESVEMARAAGSPPSLPPRLRQAASSALVALSNDGERSPGVVLSPGMADHLTHRADPDQDHADWDLAEGSTPAHQDWAIAPTLIDAKVTLVGYVKHPLERVLGWIDLGMVWVETVLIQVWTWLRRSISGDRS